MPKGIYKRTPECNAINSKSKKGVPRKPFTPEHRANMSDAHIGVPLSPEHCASLSEAGLGVPNTPEHNAAIKKGNAESNIMRGGIDLVWHHISYDFGRPDALRVRITRKFHASIHHPKGIQYTKRGYSLID